MKNLIADENFEVKKVKNYRAAQDTYSYTQPKRGFCMKTLGDLAKHYGIEIECGADLEIVKLGMEGASSMYFSGDVVRHITVKVEGRGLNHTGTWPYYLVSDNGNMMILAAS